MVQLKLDEYRPAEIIHHYEPVTATLIESTGNRFLITEGTDTAEVVIPTRTLRDKVLKHVRLSRRAMRLDKSNAVLTKERDAVILVYQGGIYRYDRHTRELRQTGRLHMCRNVLHGGICVAPNANIYIGEYGANPSRERVPIWCSRDGGQSWTIVYEFAAGSIKHIHGVFYDAVAGKLWVPTGDFEGECYLYCADYDFSDVQRFGDGSQDWRFVSCFFEKDKIIWGMDSQLETSYLQVFDRETGVLSRGREFPGPVWYSKRLSDGYYLLQTTCETGPGVKTDFVHLFLSTDGQEWSEIARYKKDLWPKRYFKYGILAFADGEQSGAAFAMHAEALQTLDGKAVIASLGRPAA